ncbi:hypothetical protein N7466_006454 [Penicillium verhagenii]|uniref:uncharacterized protein n=1 Tax=Penicillium verhagenii TaxID=1562060 RepID=UPI0025451F25|nr:uncharacterized protein N7466_006454 [Penicillium verhagenii]KAJ5930961.1 hypothetical protein N7466_006454 [Penicillium verhagenii]
MPSMQDFEYQLGLLKLESEQDEIEDASLAPVFAGPILDMPIPTPSQYGLLGGVKSVSTLTNQRTVHDKDPRLLFNVASPSSTFICGSQGSGKSHTLSCLLEDCLIPSRAGQLSNPLTAVIFHYDTFISDTAGSPCEAAFLSTDPNIVVRVLCAPTNIRTIKRTYSRFSNITVEPLKIDQIDLNTKRMLDLMGVGQDSSSPLPLYMYTIQRVLREMRIDQQTHETEFDYANFKYRIGAAGLLLGQLEPLKQRLDCLESFMPPKQTITGSKPTGKKDKDATTRKSLGSSWKPKASQLTIVDLSCPCISADTACSLFNVCFGIFMEQDSQIGRIIALDEAHKYMKGSVEAKNFTETLLSTIRLQRHLGARIFVSTQDPTISSDLISLCSITIVHRFSSPAWLYALQGQIAAAALGAVSKKGSAEDPDVVSKYALFHQIVRLRVGEALLFCPNAAFPITPEDDKGVQGSKAPKLMTLGAGYVVIKVRDRLTEDGGKSVLSS